MKVSELIKHLKSYDLDEEIAYSLWSRDDIIIEAKSAFNEKLTDDEINEVLINTERGHDCSVGISWDIIACHISDIITNR